MRLAHMRLARAVAIGSLLVFGVTSPIVAPNVLFAQFQQYPPPGDPKPDDEGPRLPNGKLQRDVILKHEHEQNLEELRRIHKISGELIEEMEKDSAFVLSLKSLKKLEELEELSKDVRKRFKK